tara:strand:+ start:3357 stop:4760 length:1404 start_codon:yes stop_codon:yes gene_type:complete
MIGDAIGGALGGAGAGAGIGAVLAPAAQGAAGGGPVGAVIGAGLGLVSGVLGGSSKKKAKKKASRDQRKVTRKTHKYNRSVWKYNWKEARDKYEYEKDGLAIRKRNDREQREYQEQINENNYDHAMAIRDYEFNQANRAYEASIDAANEQISFNEMASNFAVQQQDRHRDEMMRGLMFDKKQTLIDYALKTAGFENQRGMLVNQRKTIKAKSAFETQASRLEGLKASSAAEARGPGRSNAKAVQAAMAESGANEAAIAEQLMFGLKDINMSIDAVNIQAEAMSNQLILDNARLAATVANLNVQDKMARENIEFQLLDANRRAEASIHMRPEMTPPMPKPVALPTPEYQDIYEPKRPPKPKKGANVAIGAQPSFAQSVIPQAMGAVQSFAKAGMFSGGGGYAENTSPLSMFQNAPTNMYNQGLSSSLNSSGLFSGIGSVVGNLTSAPSGFNNISPMTSGMSYSSAFNV